MKVRICLSGVGGYGHTYIHLLRTMVPKENYELVAVVDPYIEKAEDYGYITENNIPIYRDFDECLEKEKLDLVIVSTPIHLHKKQTVAAIKKGINVLCEKPLTPLVQDAYEMAELAKQKGVIAQVGFQRSFTENAIELKEDIMNGVLGRPIHLKAVASTPRYDDYYNKGWNGRVKDSGGGYILDSNILNAFAHYIHSGFWLLGDKLDTAKCPDEIYFTAYRAKNIETFDTCDVKGSFDNGATFSFYSSHSAERFIWFDAEYTFENAVVKLCKDKDLCIAYFNDGRVKKYGTVQSGDEATVGKITGTIKAIKEGCATSSSFESAIPHLTVCNAMMDFGTIKVIDNEFLYRTHNPDGTLVKGLSELIEKAFIEDKTFYELGVKWAKEPDYACLKDYKAFKGDRLK